MPPGPLISGVLYDLLRCCWAALWLLDAIAGREGPRGFLWGAPSLDGARGIAGAVYLWLGSSHPGWGVRDLGNW